MIAFLQGRLAEAGANRVVVDVGGVGYEIAVSAQCSRMLPAPGAAIKILTHQHVREDALDLYGFLNENERDLFKLLLGVSGIGPKVAMNILSGIAVEEFYRAVRDRDQVKLSSVPGIGKKTAERLLLELREKAAVLSSAPAKGTRAAIIEGRHGDALRALIALGFKQLQAQTAIEKVAKNMDGQKTSTEELIKEALKLAGKA